MFNISIEESVNLLETPCGRIEEHLICSKGHSDCPFGREFLSEVDLDLEDGEPYSP